MHKLRLRIPEDPKADDPIPFPDLARFAREDTARPGDLKLTESIDAAFERVQRELDDLSEEIDRAYHLPVGDDWPPSAA